MAGVPRNFEITAPPNLTTFTFTDTATKTGYIEFYGMKTNEGTFLVTNSIDSNINDVYTDVTGTNQEVNFDITFKAPQTIVGNSFLSATMAIATSSTAASGYFKARVLHVRGGVETEIGAQVTGDTFTTPAVGSLYETWVRFTLMLTITQTHFKIGDTLRLEVIAYGSGGGGTRYQYLWHDPGNTATGKPEYLTGRAPSSILVFQVPFKINL